MNASAQKVSLISLQNAVKQLFSKQPGFSGFPTEKNVEYYFIDDISSQEPIAEQKYGIYIFGWFGADIPRWILWYDATGYKIYDQPLDTDMLGEILAFLKRNNYSEAASYRYILGLYKACYQQENVGIREVTEKIPIQKKDRPKQSSLPQR